MTGSPRLSTLLCSALLCLAPAALAAQDVKQIFDEGVALMRRGRDEEALQKFQQVLAADPSHEEAYELWKSTDAQVWTQLMAKEGQYQLISQRIMSLGKIGRRELGRDTAAIRAHLSTIVNGNSIERSRAVLTLSAEHGEFAVPEMLRGLADRSDEDKRVLYMQALTNMSQDVVLPLNEALRSSDEFLRRNVALTLGYISDPRAAGMLAWAAQTDPDLGVQSAARQALERMGLGAEALSHFLALGEAYRRRDLNVLSPAMYSAVVWSWSDGGLVATEVPRALYAEEMAKKNFYNALEADPGSLEALSGLARAYASQVAELEQLEGAGADVADLLEQARRGLLSIEVAGVDALEAALGRALDVNDDAAAIGLARVLGNSATSASPGLVRALEVGGSNLRAETAVALGTIAWRTSSSADPAVVEALAEATGRTIVRIGAVVGSGGDALAAAMRNAGMLVNTWDRGTRAIASMRRIPGLDVLLVAAELPDLTAHQVVTDAQADPKYAGTPILIFSSDTEAAEALWGDRVAGVIAADGSDLSALDEVLSGALSGDRAEADRLAQQSAHVLEYLARAGNTDVSSAADDLASALTAKDPRPDSVIVPAIGALGAIGTLNQHQALLGTVTDDSRSTEARAAAADALAEIFSRNNQVGSDVIEALNGVMTSEADLPVRQAAARALGRLDLAPDVRAGLLRTVRVDIGVSADA